MALRSGVQVAGVRNADLGNVHADMERHHFHNRFAAPEYQGKSGRLSDGGRIIIGGVSSGSFHVALIPDLRRNVMAGRLRLFYGIIKSLIDAHANAAFALGRKAHSQTGFAFHPRALGDTEHKRVVFKLFILFLMKENLRVDFERFLTGVHFKVDKIALIGKLDGNLILRGAVRRVVQRQKRVVASADVI